MRDEQRAPARVISGRGSEAVVQSAFVRWLQETGWTIRTDHGTFADVVAARGAERLVGEVKGFNQSNTGLDIDTLYGQLLRRMATPDEVTWAVVVPTRSLRFALRVPSEIRQRLGIRVFEVTDEDIVIEHG